ncbi:hypothetical protein [Curtobacterium poinsettiae]|uniref:hypothetical protein n=1 Tax=Curtobacterium TaxID=2034 RepID=UPI001BE0B1B8|nr:hypothetical protein [Curtobacterium flaccumfaciens]MBT1620570.1 hypothetical protein [Curtobacterium flaccumfaciens pv. poinsettiae]MCS6563600.1 hypothetical protein [Curtobacterium flaccumfaciens pv. poinsettiae]MCU0154538.1 hypothetical protein [Curtobacterium flaccumfaciens pv. poinsettiae]UXN16925.1 hypothetical protein N8D76_17220 [Curtobacterium flaccumfaciens pv. poinsettiae]UXN30483.1 hypothetical protein N8D75_17785 [Curtobacterium flaccumfaciens]
MERAAEFRRRQEQLEELAAEYFVAADAVDGINEDAEARIQKIRDEAAAAVADAEERARAIIGRMLDTKVTRDEVAERLGVPVRDVKRAKTKAATAPESRSDDVTGEAQPGGGDSPVETGAESYAA